MPLTPEQKEKLRAHAAEQGFLERRDGEYRVTAKGIEFLELWEKASPEQIDEMFRRAFPHER
jgi:hypothetical protein